MRLRERVREMEVALAKMEAKMSAMATHDELRQLERSLKGWASVQRRRDMAQEEVDPSLPQPVAYDPFRR